MSERLERRAEVIKLARQMTVSEEELEFLEALPAHALRTYREAVTDRLFAADAGLFGRVAAAARLIPGAVIAPIAEHAFGPVLSARAVGQIEPDKALDVMKRLKAEFIADATIEVDPRRILGLIAGIPKEIVVGVSEILGKRGEYVTMGRFLAFIPDHAIVGAMGVLSDEALLRTAFVLEHKDRLDHAVGLLPADRLPGVLVEASRLDLWPEALDLLSHLSDERRGPIADTLAAQPEEVVAGMVQAATENELWDDLLPVVRTMSPNSRVRLAEMAPFHAPEVLSEIVRVAADGGLWVELVPLVEALPASARAEVGRIAPTLSDEQLLRIIDGALEHPDTLPTLFGLVAEIDPEGRARIEALLRAATSAQ